MVKDDRHDTARAERPLLTVDIVLLCRCQGEQSVLLIQRQKPPFQGMWALPGGKLNVGETLYQAAQRELQEETGIPPLPLEQLALFDDPGRDPRGRVISVAYLAI